MHHAMLSAGDAFPSDRLEYGDLECVPGSREHSYGYSPACGRWHGMVARMMPGVVVRSTRGITGESQQCVAVEDAHGVHRACLV